MDCSPPGSSVHGISQARILEWVAISFSRGSSWPRDQALDSSISSSLSKWFSSMSFLHIVINTLYLHKTYRFDKKIYLKIIWYIYTYVCVCVCVCTLHSIYTAFYVYRMQHKVIQCWSVDRWFKNCLPFRVWNGVLVRMVLGVSEDRPATGVAVVREHSGLGMGVAMGLKGNGQNEDDMRNLMSW